MNQGLLPGILTTTLSDVVVMYFKAHGHHWNVTGPDFAQFHDFFANIYEDVYGSIDPMAENIRKLGANAPCRLQEFAMMSTIADAEVGNNAQAMLSDLMDANEGVLNSLNNAFEAATNENEQGIVNFIAERLDQHEKWRWQISAFLAPQSRMMPEKFEAVPSLMTRADAPVMVQPMLETDIVSMPSSWCSMCADGNCTCPVGECECDGNCQCEECSYFRAKDMITAAGSKPAPKKDRIKGSKVNKKGSATGGKRIVFSDKVETALRNKVKDHNEKAPSGRQATLGQLKAVYRRGAGAFSSSHRPGMARDQWAMARVNAYLHLLKSGSPKNPKYTQDNDLLPSKHPKATLASETVIASAVARAELTITLKNEKEYNSSEDAIVALAEYSGLGYEIMPSLRAAWRRADANENGFERAKELAINLYDSKDCDLLPLQQQSRLNHG
jgi:starvation-inducible DNA-binding protein